MSLFPSSAVHIGRSRRWDRHFQFRPVPATTSHLMVANEHRRGGPGANSSFSWHGSAEEVDDECLARLDAAEREMSEARARIRSRQADRTSVRNDLQDQLLASTSALSQLKDAHAALEADHSKASSSLTAANAMREEAEAECAQVQVENVRLGVALMFMMTRVSELAAESMTVQKRLKTATTVNKRVQEELQLLQLVCGVSGPSQSVTENLSTPLLPQGLCTANPKPVTARSSSSGVGIGDASEEKAARIEGEENARLGNAQLPSTVISSGSKEITARHRSRQRASRLAAFPAKKSRGDSGPPPRKQRRLAASDQNDGAGSAAGAERKVVGLPCAVEAVGTDPGTGLDATEAQKERDCPSNETTVAEVGEEDAAIDEVIVPLNGANGGDNGGEKSGMQPHRSANQVVRQQGFEALTLENTNLTRSKAAAAFYTALEKAALWDAMYERRVKVSYTFEYDAQDVDVAVKKWIHRVLCYQFKFRQAIWERQHWAPLWVSKPDTAAIAATNMRRVQRQSCALKEWRAIRKEGTNLVKRGLVSEYVWLEPFVWEPEEKPCSLLDGCSSLEKLAELDAAEPRRVYHVNDIRTHSFFAFEMDKKYNKAFVLPKTCYD